MVRTLVRATNRSSDRGTDHDITRMMSILLNLGVATIAAELWESV